MNRIKLQQWRAIASAVIAAAAFGPLAASADLTAGCPSYVYLGNNPNGTDLPDWSENAQGIANDGRYWYFTKRTRLYKYEANWRPINGNDLGLFGDSVTFPPVLSNAGINHFGDPDQYAGYIFVPFEGPNSMKAVIAVFRTADLAFVDWFDLTAYQPKAGWAAIDPVEVVLYTSDDHLVAGTPILRYALDVSKIENGIIGDFLTPTSPVAVLDSDGGDVSGQFIYMQGGVFTPWGDLFLSVGKAADSASSTRGGLHLFRRSADGSSFQLIESSLNVGLPAGAPGLVYEYHPGLTGFGEEPEGIDWWNRANDPTSRYAGQLHAILLDNQLGDDQIWLKHYTVDYHCVAADDTDGDGVTDGDEVYVYNTHPLLPDSDGDGVLDPSDNCPQVANPGQQDQDGDGLGDACDLDSDGDGQADADEQACGSDPADPSSLSPDLDADGLPDCVDDDDDGDGLSDVDELNIHGTDPLRADTDGDGLSDGAEVNTHGTDPLDADSDDDGLSDGDEVNVHGTDPLDADSDDDGLGDGLELQVGTDPLDADSDDDGIVDGQDVDFVLGAIDALSDDAFRSTGPGMQNALQTRLENLGWLVARGGLATALQTLRNVRMRVDGCGVSADANDWIVDCSAQIAIRDLLDLVAANLEAELAIAPAP